MHVSFLSGIDSVLCSLEIEGPFHCYLRENIQTVNVIIIVLLSYLPVLGDEETMSEVAYPSRRSRFGHPARSSSSAMIPLQRLDTLREASSVDLLNERKGEKERAGPGISSLSASDPPASSPFLHQIGAATGNVNSSSDNLRNEHPEAEEEEHPSSPPPAWAAEPRDNNRTRNPLLRRPQWNPKT